MSLFLLIGSALFLKAFHNAQAIDPGFRTDKLAILTIDPALAGYDKVRAAQVAPPLPAPRHDQLVWSYATKVRKQTRCFGPLKWVRATLDLNSCR